jgi:hypothetical protein
VSNLKSPHFNAGWAAMAKYVLYLFHLQHNTGKAIIQQRMHLIAYEEQTTIKLREMERLRYENAILRHRTLQSLDKDLELQVVCHCLNETEHRWNYARQQLDLAVRWRTPGIT